MNTYQIIAAALVLAVSIVGQEIQAQEAPSALSLEERMSIIERKDENDQEAAAAKAKDGATATAGKDGFTIKSNDGSFALKVGGLVQEDYRDYHSDHGAYQFADQFLVRRARI